jgi:hypothetical protein
MDSFTLPFLHQSITVIIISRRMMWMRLMASVDEMRIAFRIVIRKPEGKKPLENVGVDGSM